jgi:hypothetical protein
VLNDFSATRAESESAAASLLSKETELRDIFAVIDSVEALVMRADACVSQLEARCTNIENAQGGGRIARKIGSFLSAFSSEKKAKPVVPEWSAADATLNVSDFMHIEPDTHDTQ